MPNLPSFKSRVAKGISEDEIAGKSRLFTLPF